MEILGIDEFAKEKREDRSWRGVKEFYLQKVEEMKVLSDRKENVTNIDKLVSACAAKIVENMERQLSRMKLFSENVPENIKIIDKSLLIYLTYVKEIVLSCMNFK